MKVRCVIALLMLCSSAFGVVRYNGQCSQGGQQVTTAGILSTSKVLASYPSCTVTVFLAGTSTLATLYSDSSLTPLSNPFAANSDGSFSFYVADGFFDIQTSGAGILSPITLRGVEIAVAAGVIFGTDNTWTGTNTFNGQTNLANVTTAGPVINVKYPTYGAKGDGVKLSGVCSGASGQRSLVCTGASFTSADVGKQFSIDHAGTTVCGQQYWNIVGVNFACNLVGTISSVTNSTTVVLSTNILTTVSNDTLRYATDDRAAISSAMDAAISSHACVYFPRGFYGVGTPGIQKKFTSNCLVGDSPDASQLWNMDTVAYNTSTVYHTLTVQNGTTRLYVANLGFDGTNELGELTSFGVDTADGLYVCTAADTSDAFCGGVAADISDISIANVYAGHHWGIGIHNPGSGQSSPGKITGIQISHSLTEYNSYDGFNMNPFDDLKMEDDTARFNGTGGSESAVLRAQQYVGGSYSYNRLLGISAGGFGSAVAGSSLIIGDLFAEHNGNGSATDTGSGIVVSDGQQNCSIQNVTARLNGFLGIQYNGLAAIGTNWCAIIGNHLDSNGSTTGGQIGTGLYLNSPNALVAYNFFADEGITGFQERTGINVGSNSSAAVIGPNYYLSTFTNGAISSTATSFSFFDFQDLGANSGATGTITRMSPTMDKFTIYEPGYTNPQNNQDKVVASFDGSHNFKLTQSRAGTVTTGTFDLASLGQMDLISGSATSVVIEPGGAPKVRFDSSGDVQGFSDGGWTIGAGANRPDIERLKTSLSIAGGSTLTTTNQSGTGSLCMAINCAMTTPSIGAATGTSLNLGGTGVLSTTAQSGTGSICMTTNCAMTTPSLGAATATSVSASSFLSAGATPALSGDIRMQNQGNLSARNAANTGDIVLFQLGPTNNLNFDPSAALSGVTFNDTVAFSGIKLAGGTQQIGPGLSVVFDAANPTIGSGFGTSPSISLGTDGTAAFTVTVGTGGTATSGVVNFPHASALGWTCTGSDLTTQSATVFMLKQIASTTTTATLANYNTSGVQAAWVAGDVLAVHCTGR